MKKTKAKDTIKIDNLLLPITGLKGFVKVTIEYYRGIPELLVIENTKKVILKRNLRAEANPLK